MKIPMKRTLGCLLLCSSIVPMFGHSGHDEELFFAQLAKVEQSNNALVNRAYFSVEGDTRIIRANGIPDHETGPFPNRNNPNRIAAQDYLYRVPAKPQVADHTTALRMGPFGIALNGVVFDPFAAEWWEDDPRSPWQYEPMNMDGRLGADQNNAHVQPTGAYHYHSVPTGLVEKLSGGKHQMTQIGWAADGFPMYGPWCYSDAKNTNSAIKEMKSSYRIKNGTRPDGPGGKYDGTFVADYEYAAGAGDLDECNGRFGPTPEFPQGTYYYVLTQDFPFIPRFFKGTPDQSFMRHGPPGGPRRGPPGGRRGPPPGPQRAFIQPDEDRLNVPDLRAQR